MNEKEDLLELFFYKHKTRIIFSILFFIFIFIITYIYQNNKEKEKMYLLQIQNEIIYQNNVSNIMEIKNDKLKNLLLLHYYIKNDKMNKFNNLKLNEKEFEDNILLKLKNYHNKLSKNTIESNNTLFQNLHLFKKISFEMDNNNFDKNLLNDLNKISLDELDELKDIYNHILVFKNKKVENEK